MAWFSGLPVRRVVVRGDLVSMAPYQYATVPGYGKDKLWLPQAEAVALDQDDLDTPYDVVIGKHTATIEQRDELVRRWSWRVERRRGAWEAVDPKKPLQNLVTHEFGHVAEAYFTRVNPDGVLRAYAHLSKAVINSKVLPNERQWLYHLVNYLPVWHNGEYPKGLTPLLPSSVAVRAVAPWQKHFVAPYIKEMLGAYATTNRMELFAEAFTAAFWGTPSMRKRLAPFLKSLLS